MMTIEEVAGVFGIGAPVLRYLFGLLASIPCSWLRRYVPGATGRHLYAAATGALLSYCSFGATSTVYFGILMLGSYLSMLMFRRHCGIITFVHAFAILLTCHLMSMREEKSNTRGGHSIGAMMVLTLKVISAAINYQDGLIQDEDSLRNAQKNCRLQELPSPIAFIGYCLNCGTHLAGPVFEIRDYLDWTENKGYVLVSLFGEVYTQHAMQKLCLTNGSGQKAVLFSYEGVWCLQLWSPTAAMQPPSPYKFALVAILKAFACMGIYMYLMNYFTIQQLSGAEYWRWGIWNRICYQYLCAFTARWKYYIVWSLSETSMIISGFGFSGWTKASPSEEEQPKWTRAKNVYILQVELPRSAVEIPVYWNIHVGIWLRHYIYERLTRNGEKPGFMQLLATQLTSAVWHGLYPGYVVFFVNTVFMIAGARVLYRWWKLIPEKAVVARRLATFVNGLYAVVVINLTSIAFMLLDYAHTMAAFRSVYYIGTWIPFLVMVLGSVIKVQSTERKQRAKRKSRSNCR